MVLGGFGDLNGLDVTPVGLLDMWFLTVLAKCMCLVFA